MSHTTREGVLAVIRRFPAKRREIEALARERESFGEMCDELAAAEQALADVDRLDEAARAERRFEWLRFIRETLTEIAAELHQANVIPIERGAHRPP